MEHCVNLARTAGPTRRELLIGAASALLVPAAARAQAFPSKPLRVIAAGPAGATADLVARLVTEPLAKELGQTAIVEPKPGAAGAIAVSDLMQSPHDGHTLLVAVSSLVSEVPHMVKLRMDMRKELQPVAELAAGGLVLVGHPGFPAKNLAELVAYVKANPGKVNYASPGNGSPHHLAMEMFKVRTGTFITHIPYRGAAPAMADVMGGQVPCMFLDLASGLSIMQSNKVRVLAIGSGARSKLLPNVPTLAEVGVPNTEVFAFQGILGPANLSPAVVTKLNGDLNKAFGTPTVQKRFEDFGMEAMPGTPAQFAALSRAESKRWGPIIKQAGIKLD